MERLEKTGGHKAKESAVFTGLIDKFFDILNASNFTKWDKEHKAISISYEDHRLNHAGSPDDFIIVARNRLSRWEASVKARTVEGRKEYTDAGAQ